MNNENLLIQVLVILLVIVLAFLLIINTIGIGACEVLKPVTLEDSRPWEEEVPAPDPEPGDWDQRLFNVIMDSLIFFCFQVLLMDYLKEVSPKQPPVIVTIFLTGFLWVLYYPVMEHITGKTFAKYITQTRAVNDDLSPLSFGDSLVRNLLRFIPFEIFSFLQAQPVGWHDRWAGTLVVSEPPAVILVPWKEEYEAL